MTSSIINVSGVRIAKRSLVIEFVEQPIECQQVYNRLKTTESYIKKEKDARELSIGEEPEEY